MITPIGVKGSAKLRFQMINNMVMCKYRNKKCGPCDQVPQLRAKELWVGGTTTVLQTQGHALFQMS